MKNKSSNVNRLKAWLAQLLGYKSPQLRGSDTGKRNPYMDRMYPAGPFSDEYGKSAEDNNVPASEPVLITRDAALALLQSYGLDTVLTPEDDPTLWAAVIAVYWPPPHNAEINVGGLRFGVGTFDDDTRVKLQPIAGWCFERADETTLRLTECHDRDIDGRSDPNFRPLPNTTLFNMTGLGTFLDDDTLPPFPTISIVVERPSVGKQDVVVYDGAQFYIRIGAGRTGVYTRVDGGWQESGRILHSWLS